MKNLLIAMCAAAALAACSKKDEVVTTPAVVTTPVPPAVTATTTTTPAAITTTTTTTARAATVATASTAELPKECQEYLDKVSACAAKQSGPVGDALRQSVDATRSTWNSIGSANRDSLVSACKQVSTAFSVQSAALRC